MITDVLLSFLWKTLESVFTIIIISHLLKAKFLDFFQRIIPALVIFFIESCITIYWLSSDISIYVLNLTTMILVIKLIFKESLFNTIYIYGFTYCICIILQLIIVFFMGLTATSLTDTFAKLTGNSLTIVLALLVCRFIPIRKLFENIGQIHKNIKLWLCNCYLLIFFFVLCSKLSTTLFFQSFVIVVLGCFLILFFNIHTMYYTHKMERQLLELESYKRYLPIVNELIDYVRIRQHGIDNRLLSLRSLPMNYHSYEALAQVLAENIDFTIQEYEASKFLQLNHKLVAGFLFNKYSESEKSGYTLKIDLCSHVLPEHVPEYVLIDMIGILLDNALEASSSESPIYFSLSVSTDNLIEICCKNEGPEVTPQFQKNLFKKGYTTKSNVTQQHGLGLYALKKYLKQYNGVITHFDNEYIDNKRYFVFGIRI